MRTLTVAILGTILGICGCAPVHPVGSGPNISDTLQSLKLDTSDAGAVAAFANALLAGSEIEYRLEGREVKTATKYRSFLDRATDTGTRRMVQVVVLSGEGTRDGQEGSYTANLYHFGDTDIWITMTWPDMELLTADGDVTLEEGFRFRSRGAGKFYPHLAYYTVMELYCGCDKPGGTVNGAPCTHQQCQDLKTCSKPKPGGGTENGSCFLGGTV